MLKVWGTSWAQFYLCIHSKRMKEVQRLISAIVTRYSRVDKIWACNLKCSSALVHGDCEKMSFQKEKNARAKNIFPRNL